MENRIWKPIKGWPHYEISNDGYIRNSNKRILGFNINGGGYRRIHLRRHQKTTFKFVHKLVYENFVGPIPEGLVIDHIDRDKYNNTVENLRAVTRKKNQSNVDWKKRSYRRYTDGQKRIILNDLLINSAHSIYNKYGISYPYLCVVQKDDNAWNNIKKEIGWFEKRKNTSTASDATN